MKHKNRAITELHLRTNKQTKHTSLHAEKNIPPTFTTTDKCEHLDNRRRKKTFIAQMNNTKKPTRLKTGKTATKQPTNHEPECHVFSFENRNKKIKKVLSYEIIEEKKTGWSLSFLSIIYHMLLKLKVFFKKGKYFCGNSRK